MIGTWDSSSLIGSKRDYKNKNKLFFPIETHRFFFRSLPAENSKKNSSSFQFPFFLAWWVKKRYPLFFRKYEIHKGRHLYRTHKKAGILQCTCRLKKIQIILTEKFNRSITCTNAEMKPGRGGKSFFPPTKDIGTNVGDCVGKGKYFPYCK